jgi:hypothetical protein
MAQGGFIMPAFNIQSQVTLLGVPLVIDIKGANKSPVERPAVLVADQPNGNDSQLWTQVPSKTNPGWYTLQSNLKDKKTGDPLVIDIMGAANDPVELPAALDVWIPTGNLNQLWQFVSGPPAPAGWYVIQSYLKEKKTGDPLVIDIRGVTTPTVTAKHPSTALDVWRQKSADNYNQLWQIAG